MCREVAFKPLRNGSVCSTARLRLGVVVLYDCICGDCCWGNWFISLDLGNWGVQNAFEISVEDLAVDTHNSLDNFCDLSDVDSGCSYLVDCFEGSVCFDNDHVAQKGGEVEVGIAELRVIKYSQSVGYITEMLY